MKKIQKSSEPGALTFFKKNHPTAGWEDIRAEKNVYQAIVDATYKDQGGICAFCEKKLAEQDRGIEHFRQKSASPQQSNWAADWPNMLAVCKGGEASKLSYSLPRNLSCDKHKNHWVNLKLLPADSEGYLLNPLCLQANHDLFELDRQTGHLKANPVGCDQHPLIQPNYLPDATNLALVKNTIQALNLNCPRLSRERLLLYQEIQKQLNQYRRQNEKPKYAKQKLAQRYFKQPWPAYFTVLNILLAPASKQYLLSQNYQG